MNTTTLLQVGTILHGTFRIVRYLASGGFGNTYVARNIELGKDYAIKEFFIKGVCQRDGDSTTISVSNSENTCIFEQQREKFKKEARRLCNLNNPHIVKVYDLFEENGTAYYVMDYVDGETLSARLKRTQTPLPETEVRYYLAQILDGLETIHAAGIYHLDIKPANIMVDKEQVVKLIDFGASKQQSVAGGATTSTAISYTKGYAPSEQMQGELAMFGPWTDFYALGATLYKLLTNQDPPSITALNEDDTWDKQEALPMPSYVSANMKRLVVRLMQVARKNRPQNVAEVRHLMNIDATSQHFTGNQEETVSPHANARNGMVMGAVTENTVLEKGHPRGSATTRVQHHHARHAVGDIPPNAKRNTKKSQRRSSISPKPSPPNPPTKDKFSITGCVYILIIIFIITFVVKFWFFS